MKNKMYQVVIGSLTTTKTEGQPDQTNYNPDARQVMVVAKDVAEAISKITLGEGEHVESVARHNFIDVV